MAEDDGFERAFGIGAQSRASAPGRVSVLGEHTDYNDGLVLPTVIAQQTRVALAEAADGVERIHSAQLGRSPAATAGTPVAAAAAPAGEAFGRYVSGCAAVVRERGHRVPPLWVYVDSQVPIGAGLSSSAALEVATLRALRIRYGLPFDDVQIARLAQEAEVRFAGVQCGILDQMACSVGAAGKLLFLDTRSFATALVPLPDGAELCVIDSGTSRTLAASAYNQRRHECEQAAVLLGCSSLRDVSGLSALAPLPPPLGRRARHVLTENARVRRAVAGVSAVAFGELMNASHASLKADYEVSETSVDVLAGCLQHHPAVFGAKLTGAGFGGACVALVERGAKARVESETLARYAAQGYRGTALV